MRRRVRATLALALLTTTLATGCRISRTDTTEENAVSTQVEHSHRFEVDLTGPFPTREQLGLAPGDSMQDYTAPDNGLTVVYRLAGGRTLTVPASSVTVSTTSMAVTTPRSPEAPDELVLPNEVAATQNFTTRDEGRTLLLEQADVLGLDPADIDIWYASAPEAKGPNVMLDKMYLSGTSKIGYVDVSVGIFMSDLAYIIWDLSWDPPIPGYAYDSSGVPRPQTS